MSFRDERCRRGRKEGGEARRGCAGTVGQPCSPQLGAGRIPPRLLAIQQACHAFLPTFPGAQEAGGEGLGPVPGGSGTLPGPTPTNAQCWLHASGGPPVIWGVLVLWGLRLSMTELLGMSHSTPHDCSAQTENTTLVFQPILGPLPNVSFPLFFPLTFDNTHLCASLWNCSQASGVYLDPKATV